MGSGHLVVVLPGIGGSVLARGTDWDAEVVWDAGKRSVARLAFRSDRLGVDERLTPIGVTRSMKFMGFTVVPGYERLLSGLSMLGTLDPGHPGRPVPDADIVVVPYDFRFGIMAAAERLDAVVRARLEGLSPAERAGRVVVVAHSLGGLVARAWMGLVGQAGEERWRWCRALVSLGTPHRGAPKALDWVVNGAPLGLPGPTRLVREWPSVAELLPRYPAVRDVRVGDPTAEGAALYPYEMPVLGLGQRAREAYELHEQILEAWESMPRSGPEMVACIGWPHPTPDAAYWDGAKLTVVKERPSWLEARGWESDVGDGTVPGISAVPIEQDQDVDGPRRLPDRHIRLASADVVLELLRKYLEVEPPSKYRDPRRPRHAPSLGLDVEEVHAAGKAIPVSVIARETDPALGGQPVWARLTAADGSAVRVRLDPEGGVFRGVLPGRPPGLFGVRVDARAVPGVGDLTCADTVAVVDEGLAGG